MKTKWVNLVTNTHQRTNETGGDHVRHDEGQSEDNIRREGRG